MTDDERKQVRQMWQEFWAIEFEMILDVIGSQSIPLEFKKQQLQMIQDYTEGRF